MKRRDFIKAGALLTGGVVLSGHRFLTSINEMPEGFKKIRGDVGIFAGRGGTMGWYASKDASIVIDSQFPETAQKFLDGFKGMAPGKIHFLINTHHHRDHTGGNNILRDHTNKIVSSEKSRELQEKFYGNDTKNLQAYADITFKREWTLEVGSETIHAIHISAAHTGGDAIIHFQNANVVHMGDLVFNKVYPVIDLPGGSDLYGWINFLEKTEELFDKDTKFIFGHAQKPEMVIGEKSDVTAMKNYIEALVNFTNEQIELGKSKEEFASAASIPNVSGITEMWNGAMKRNLESAYDFLSSRK